MDVFSRKILHWIFQRSVRKIDVVNMFRWLHLRYDLKGVIIRNDNGSQFLVNDVRSFLIYLEAYGLYAIEFEHTQEAEKRLPSRTKESLFQPELPNSVWSMDFMHDRLINGRSFRTLNIVDDFNREIINIVVDTSMSAQRVARELTQLFEWRGKPKMIRVDNGPEFLALSDWCKNNGVKLKYIQPAKPNQNAYIERFQFEPIVTKY